MTCPEVRLCNYMYRPPAKIHAYGLEISAKLLISKYDEHEEPCGSEDGKMAIRRLNPAPTSKSPMFSNNTAWAGNPPRV